MEDTPTDMRSDRTVVDYASIADDYAFFLAHSSETEAQIAALAPHMADFASAPRPRGMLDFGCGDGTFAGRLLRTTTRPQRLALVEPVEPHLDQARQRLAGLADVVDAYPAWPENGFEGAFDLVIANHSLYYVQDLALTVAELVGSLKPDGRLVIASLSADNALAGLWQKGFALIDQPFPFALAEEIEIALTLTPSVPHREEIAYRISFTDTPEARLHVIRFLFGAQIADAHSDRLLPLFDRFQDDGRVQIQTTYPHIVATRQRR